MDYDNVLFQDSLKVNQSLHTCSFIYFSENKLLNSYLAFSAKFIKIKNVWIKAIKSYLYHIKIDFIKNINLHCQMYIKNVIYLKTF